MDKTADRPAGRIRERAAKPKRPPWTYRCHLSLREPGIDVDAFTRDEAHPLPIPASVVRGAAPGT